MRAFLHRVSQSITVLRSKNAASILCIVIDAADNAQMAAEEVGEKRSFVKDLLREKLPGGVRVIALCRPYRKEMLDPPPSAKQLSLQEFTLEESSKHLQQRFPEATEQDIEEFHRLSSMNPRVQAFAMYRGLSLHKTLRVLGPNPTTVDSTIGSILEDSIAELRHETKDAERSQVDLICRGLAILRPMVPISVLSQISGVSEAAIKSFATDLGRPLKVSDNAIQFFDEPTETWFRKKYRPDTKCVADFVFKLKPLASESTYVAAVLPQLMLEAGQFSELVELALTSQGLPDNNPIERRDVELQRLQFAFKAALRAERYVDATKLGLKAGGESAGDDRQSKLFQSNIDLVAAFLDSNKVQELVSRGIFSSGWVGSHNVYEAFVLSEHEGLIGEARSRLRMAEEWLRNWSKLPPKERRNEDVSDEDRAVMAMAELNIHGSDAAVKSLCRWTPRQLSFSAGKIITARLLDHGRYEDIDSLSIAAGNNIWLILAIAAEVCDCHRVLPEKVIKRTLKLLSWRRLNLKDSSDSRRSLREVPYLGPITAVVEIALKLGVCSSDDAKSILEKHLRSSPPRTFSDRFSHQREPYLRAYTLVAALKQRALQLEDVTPEEFKNDSDKKKDYEDSREYRDFTRDVNGLIPWYNLWGKSLLGNLDKEHFEHEIAQTQKASAKAEHHHYNEESFISNEIAGLWIDILLTSEIATESSIQKIIDWSSTLHRQLFTPTLNRLSRLCAQTEGVEQLSFKFSSTAFELLQSERTDADSKADGYVDVARPLLNLDRYEAEEYFNQAIEVVSKIGNENIARWEALIHLGYRAARKRGYQPELAYQFARCAEVSWDYVVRDKHFAWHHTIEAITGLCPSSAIAIFSRWKDRRFGSYRPVLSTAMEKMLEDESISPLDALPCIGFQDRWDENKLLKNAIPLLKNKEDKDVVVNNVFRYMSLEKHSASKWKKFEQNLAEEGYRFPQIKDLILNSEEEEQRSGHSHYSSTPKTELSEEEDTLFDSLISGCDLTSAEGIVRAYDRFRSSEMPYYPETFFHSVIKKVKAGKEAEFIKAFGKVAKFEFYELQYLLREMPSHWTQRKGVRIVLASMLKEFCRRHCMNFISGLYYKSIPFKLSRETYGIEDSELTKEVLAGIAETSEYADSEKIFSLIGLISYHLSTDEALQALAYGLSLFDPVLEDSDADGVWTSNLLPPREVEVALAGYIWAQLGSPVAKTRWEAAHVVVLLCAMNRTKLLENLIEHYVTNSYGLYADKRFTFYSLTALQWFLIATSRAAIEYGDSLAPHAEFFRNVLKAEEPHIFIRLLTARTLKALHKAKKLQLTAIELTELENIVESPHPPLSAQKTRSGTVNLSDLGDDENEISDNDRFFFGIDFGPYWLAPLGNCFGLSEKALEAETLNTVRKDLKYIGGSRWDEDERAKLKLFRYEDTSHSHGSYPDIEDLHFYTCYHSMMITAGKLLASRPLVESTYEWEENLFSDWIRRHDITREDGRWLADRRDPEPLGRPDWLQTLSEDEWRSSISSDDFDRILYSEEASLPVWGHWTEACSQKYLVEDISVHSALVSKERSSSLLIALQTTQNPHDYKIPHFEDDLEIDSGSFCLKGWIKNSHRDPGIDTKDPWAGSVFFPVAEPAPFVIDAMQLLPDQDRRFWTNSEDAFPVFKSDAWGEEQKNDSSETTRGSLLRADTQSVLSFLETVGMNLVVEVDIKRRYPYGSHSWRKEDEMQRIPSSTKIFIIESDGSICSF